MATSTASAGTTNMGGIAVPAKAVPWVNNAVANSTTKIPASFFAYIMDRESDFNPNVFSGDINGGTWGLFQINASEWRSATGGGSFSNPNIKDPMIHTTYGAKYFDKRLGTVRSMRTKNPTKAYTTQLSELEALMIAHNAGEGNLAKYPNIPRITKSYLAEYRSKVKDGGTATGVGEAAAPVAGGTSISNPLNALDTVQAGLTAFLDWAKEALSTILMVLLGVVCIIVGIYMVAHEPINKALSKAVGTALSVTPAGKGGKAIKTVSKVLK